MSQTIPSDINAAIQAGEKLGKMEIPIKRLEPNPNQTPFIIIPDGHKVQNLKDFEPPLRKNLLAEMYDLESFNRYINEHKTSATRIFGRITETGGSFSAVIDFHTKEKADRCEHSVVYLCPASPEWIRWTGNNGKQLTQEAFARFLEDNTIDIITPDGATILEVALTLQAKNNVQFQSGIRLNNGRQRIVYQEMIEGTAGEKGDMTIPEVFTLGIPVFQNGSKYKIDARLRYRVHGGTLAFTYEMNRPHAVIKDACDGLIEKIEESTGIKAFLGHI